MRRRNETRRLEELHWNRRQPDADRLGGRRPSRRARRAAVSWGDDRGLRPARAQDRKRDRRRWLRLDGLDRRPGQERPRDHPAQRLIRQPSRSRSPLPSGRRDRRFARHRLACPDRTRRCASRFRPCGTTPTHHASRRRGGSPSSLPPRSGSARPPDRTLIAWPRLGVLHRTTRRPACPRTKDNPRPPRRR